MQNTQNQAITGGGLRMRPRAKAKMRDFIKRYHHCEPDQLPRRKRFPFVYLLSDVYAFSAADIALFFSCSKATAYRVITDARFYHNRSRMQQAEEKRIADYILYNAQWRGGVSIT